MRWRFFLVLLAVPLAGAHPPPWEPVPCGSEFTGPGPVTGVLGVSNREDWWGPLHSEHGRRVEADVHPEIEVLAYEPDADGTCWPRQAIPASGGAYATTFDWPARDYHILVRVHGHAGLDDVDRPYAILFARV